MGNSPSAEKFVPEGQYNQDLDPNVVTEYCGSWGYGANFEFTKSIILKAYPKAHVNGTKIPGATGCFEVILNKGTAKEVKVHSKLGGQGKVENSNGQKFLKELRKAVEGV